MFRGDINSYSYCWDPRCTDPSDSTYCKGIIDKLGLVIGNDDRPTHYWMRHPSMGEAILDWTLAN